MILILRWWFTRMTTLPKEWHHQKQFCVDVSREMAQHSFGDTWSMETLGLHGGGGSCRPHMLVCWEHRAGVIWAIESHCTWRGFCLHIILFLSGLGLLCCLQALSTCSEQGLCSSWVIGLPTLVASLAVEHWALGCLGSVFAMYRFNFSVACGVIWGSEIEPVSPALQGRFLTTGPPGKPLYLKFSLELPKTW